MEVQDPLQSERKGATQFARRMQSRISQKKGQVRIFGERPTAKRTRKHAADFKKTNGEVSQNIWRVGVRLFDGRKVEGS